MYPASRAGLTGTARASAASTAIRSNAAGGENYSQHTRRVLTLAGSAGDWLVGILHRTDRFEALFAIQADIFVNRHSSLVN